MQLHKIFIALFLLLTVPFVLADENGSAGPEKSASENQHPEGDHGEAHHEVSEEALDLMLEEADEKARELVRLIS